MGPFSGLSPDDIAKIESYYGAAPAPEPAPFGPPPPPPVAPEPFQAKLDATFGQPQAPRVDPVTRAPEWDPSAINPAEMTLSPPGQRPQPPPGPTAQDDAEFQQAMAKLGPAPAPSPAPRPMGPPAAKPNADPYGVNAARASYLGTFDAREEAARRKAMMAQDQAAQIGDAERELSRRRDEDAAVAHAEQAAADEDFNGRMQALQASMDDVRAKKIDPTQATKDLGFFAVLGAVAGGLYQGINHLGENPFIRDLNRMIDRNIAAQEKDLDNQRQGVADEFNVLGQQRALYKDSQAAKQAARLMYYEAAQGAIEADMKRYAGAIDVVAAEEAIQALEAEKQKHLLDFATQQQALAAKQAAGLYARDKEVQTMYREVFDKVLQSTGSPAIAEQEARRQVGVVYSPGSVGKREAVQSADPIQLVPKEMRSEAVKEVQAHANTEKVLSSVGKSYQAWRTTGATSPRQLGSTRSAIAGTIMANVPGIRSDVDFKEIVEPNLPAIGDTEETLRLKEQTIRNFVESKTTTPILDTHAPGWRQPTKDEVKATLGMKGVR